jgi:thiamine biosynthesis lipoprotein
MHTANVSHDVFPAMGTTCEVTVVGGNEALLARARERVEELESRWSRFRDTSEISRLNRHPGRATRLSYDSYLLVDRAVEAWRLTEGRYDPTVLRAMEAAGYDRSFEQVLARADAKPAGGAVIATPAPGCAGIEFDPRRLKVTLPAGVGFDPGGIGKGLAADLVVDLLLCAGAAGACVSLGGDGRMAGESPGGGWRVGIGNPYDEQELVAVAVLEDEGIATSSRLLRTWSKDGATRHHLLDPRTGQSVDNGLDAATVIAPYAWVAEILTKAAFVAGAEDGAQLVRDNGAAGLLIEGLDRMRTAGPFRRYLAPVPAAA